MSDSTAPLVLVATATVVAAYAFRREIANVFSVATKTMPSRRVLSASLASASSLNRNTARRAEILGISSPPRDHQTFSRLTAAKIKTLLRERFIESREHQNDAPTTAEILDFIETYRGATASGYAIGPERDDYRVTLTGISMKRATPAARDAGEKLADKTLGVFGKKKSGFTIWWD